MKLNVRDETSKLETVILGLALDSGEARGINPKAKHYLDTGEYPTDESLNAQVNTFQQVLTDHGVQVLRPRNIPRTDQMYTRDIAFVIGNKIVRANMKYDQRKPEYEAIQPIIDLVDPNDVILLPSEEIRIEGGDVVLYNGVIFVGQGERTNREGYEFLKQTFGDYEVIPLDLNVTGDHETNVLHLDCAFQPIGRDQAIIFKQGFRTPPEAVYDLFPEENLIKVTPEEKYKMFPNIFSLSPDLAVSEETFERLNQELRKRGVEVIAIPYLESFKKDGLFRCSTLPLYRREE
jgi:N-dimethylarginine dimethylaminohydrolase